MGARWTDTLPPSVLVKYDEITDTYLFAFRNQETEDASYHQVPAREILCHQAGIGAAFATAKALREYTHHVLEKHCKDI